MLHTTFKLARESKACRDEYERMTRSLGGVESYGENTPIPVDKVLEVCGFYSALWSLRCTIEPAEREKRLLACDYAEHVLPLYEVIYPGDSRPRYTIEVGRRYANGKATIEKLRDAREAARSARRAAEDAESAEWSSAGRVAWSSAEAASLSIAYVAWSARHAVGSASRAARDAALLSGGIVAENGEKEWQEQKLLEMLRKGG